MREQLESLQKRVAEATGPDRELDAAIVTTLCPDATVGEYIHGEGGDTVFHAQELGIPNKSRCPEFTASLDAALTLVERLLPGWQWALGSIPGRGYAEVFERDTPLTVGKYEVVEDSYEATADTPALAVLSALLRALLSEATP